MFYTLRERIGYVYIFKIRLVIEDEVKVVYKVGITTKNRIEERLSSVLAGMFTQLRYVPYTTVKRFRLSTDCLMQEKAIHKEFEDNKYVFDCRFGGCTEFFDVDEEKLLAYYDELVPLDKRE
jgi:hypothetical protein